MEWSDILAHYKRLLDASPRNQTVVATTAGLKRPNLISKMLDNNRRGPSVQTFIQAVIGLGMTPSEFFRTLEQYLQHGEAADKVILPEDARDSLWLESRYRALDEVREAFARVSKAMTAFIATIPEPPGRPQARPRTGRPKRPRVRR